MAWEAFDVETDGELREYALQPWRVKDAQAWVTSWSVSAADGNHVSFADPAQPRLIAKQLRVLVERWVDERTTVCVWNGVFDVAWLYAYGLADLCTRVKWLDGMLLWRHLENQPEYGVVAGKRTSFGLKRAVEHFLPQYAGYEEGIDFSDSNPLVLMHYNACDTWFTRALTRHFYTRLEKEPQRLRAAMIEAHSIPLIARTVYEGMEVDQEGLDSLDAVLTERIADRLGELEQHGATDKVLASSKQLSSLLFDQWGLTPIKHGKTGPSTDKETLVELAQQDDRLVLINEYREAQGNRTKFCVNVRKASEYNNDGRAHPEAKIFGTYTGRVTYASAQGKNKDRRQTGWALHQMKRADEYRRLIKAPKGYMLVELDAAGQEFRWMAELSGDPTMRKLCLPGEDPHAFMGAQVAATEYREVQEGAKHGDKKLKAFRQVGKVANLSLQFRTSAARLLSAARVNHGMLDMTLGKATHIRNTYLRSYRGVPEYWQRQIAFLQTNNYVKTLAGRKVMISPRLQSMFEWSSQSTSINYPIQGTGGDQKYLALSVIRPLLLELDAIFLFDLHDGLYFLVPIPVVDQFIAAAKHLFDNLPYQKAWGVTPSIPLPWDVKVGPTWGSMEELDL